MTNILIPLDSEGKTLYNNVSELKDLVNTKPRKTWVKQNFGVNYLPIRIVEELLRKIFPYWQVEQHGQPQIIGNSIVISVHIKVYDPFLKDWLTYAGVGAVPIQLAKGAKPLEFEKINPQGLHKNVPAALSFAVNNAAKKIGSLFGSQLNSTETIYK